MAKLRVYELAEQMNKTNKEILSILKDKGIEVASHMSTLSDEQIDAVKSEKTSEDTPKKKNIVQVFRPQNSQGGGRGRNGQGRQQGSRNGQRSQGNGKGRPQGNGNRQERPQNGNSQGRPQGNGQGRPQNGNRQERPQGNGNGQGRPQNGNRQDRPQGENRDNNRQRRNPNGPRNGQDQRQGRPGDGRRDGGFQNRGDRRDNRDNRDNRDGREMRDGGRRDDRRKSSPSIPAPAIAEQKPSRNKPKDAHKKKEYNRNEENEDRLQKGKKGKNNNAQPKMVKPQPKKEVVEEQIKQITIPGVLTIQELADAMKIQPSVIVKKLFMMGVMATQNQSLDGDTIELLMVDYGIEATKKEEVDNADIERFFVDEDYLNKDAMVERAPVVTIMGHVDHGKTTLLDTLRNSRVATGEAGGITQHIGAYQIEEGGKKITFLDTPGHAAFTSMRARGASVTDITILIVAADDGVMPQTIEAINHSKAAGVPIIVAINKIDKPGANPERVIGELAEHGVISTAWGGDSEFVEISAKFGQNIEELLETVLLVAEVEELKADPTVRAIGTVIEARLDKGKGAVATLLVQQGTLHVQDPIVVGNTFGRVRAMTNDLGRRIKTAAPSTPVSITGLNEAPMAGDHFAVYEDEKAARAAGEERAKRALMKQRQQTHRVSLDNLFDTLKAGELKTVNVIIKADVQGSVEALAASLLKIDVEGVRVNVVHSAVGAINESDITLAEASDAVVIGFNVRPTPQARQQAETDEVEIRLHSIIYKVIEEIEDAMKGMLDPEFEEKVIGEAIIRETFKVSKVGTIGGFMVTSGKITRDSSARVIRDGVVIFDGKLASLKHFKDDVKEVGNAQEGGLMIENYNDIKVDDVIEAYIMEEIKR